MSTNSQMIPLSDVGEVAWAKLAHAANDVRDPMRLVTLANVDATGRPSARLMVIRGANRDLGRIWLHTDRRSAKATQLRHRPDVCIVVYHPVERIHLRLIGRATLHDRDKVADDHWMQIMMSMRHAYGLPTSPAQPLPSADPRLNALWQHQRTTSIGEDRANFLVIEVNVESMEWLQVCGAEQRRAMLTAVNNWSMEPNPALAHAAPVEDA